MKNCFYLFIVLSITGAILTSCYNEPDIPDDRSDSVTIEKEKMIEILTDLQLVQAAMKYRENNGQDVKKLNEEYHQMIFEKYSISKQELEKNLEFYKSDVNEYNEIYEKVIENLSRLESEIKSQ